jgi:hypothetical protein
LGSTHLLATLYLKATNELQNLNPISPLTAIPACLPQAWSASKITLFTGKDQSWIKNRDKGCNLSHFCGTIPTVYGSKKQFPIICYYLRLAGFWYFS